MIRGYVVTAFAAVLLVLSGCGNKEGDEFVGKWQSARTRQSVEITRNDDGFVIANTTGGNAKRGVISASYSNGALQVDTGGKMEDIAYDKEHDVIIVPTMAGNTPFSRVR